jgi:hypothetical protein
MSSLPARSIRSLSRHWTDRLAHFRHHRNDEHREALVVEAARFSGLVLENDLSRSPYWADAPLARRVALLLYLVDRGAVERTHRDGRIVYESGPEAEAWVLSQVELAPYAEPALELIAALRNAAASRTSSEG